MGEHVSLLVTTMGGRAVLSGEWSVPHPQSARFDAACLEVGRAVMAAMYDPSAVTVQVMPTPVARRVLRGDDRSDPEDVIRLTAESYEMTTRELYRGGRTTRRPYVEARSVAMFLVRELCELSYPAIGRIFDRDHTTVQYAVSKISALIEDERPGVTERVQRLVSILTPSPAVKTPAELVPARGRAL